MSFYKLQWPLTPEQFKTDNPDEVLSDAIEDLRKKCSWVINPACGNVPFTVYTAATWSQAQNNMGTEANLVQPGLAGTTVYYNNGTFTDVYTLISGGMTRSNVPVPIDSAEVLNPNWAYAHDINKYESFDTNSGRIISTINYFDEVDGGGNIKTSYFSHEQLPPQIDKKKQRYRVKYADTGRDIPRLTPVEYSRDIFTHTQTLGPNFIVEAITRSNNQTFAVIKQDGKVAGYGASQYGIGSGLPARMTTNPFRDPKMRPSLQNQIERILSDYTWYWPTVGDSEQAATFRANWLKYVGNPEPWDPTKSYANEDIVSRTLPDGRELLFRAAKSNSGKDPLYHTWSTSDVAWRVSRMMPTLESVGHPFWECNESPFEFFLWVCGMYDWYLDTRFPHCISWYITETTKQVIRPLATWRRTWKYSMGAPKNDIDKLWPQEKGNPPHDDGYPNSDFVWYGKYLQQIPTFTLSQNEKDLIQARHGAIPATNNKAYNFEREILNNCYNVLAEVKYRNINGYIQLFLRSGSGGVPDAMESDNASEPYGVAWQNCINQYSSNALVSDYTNSTSEFLCRTSIWVSGNANAGGWLLYPIEWTNKWRSAQCNKATPVIRFFFANTTDIPLAPVVSKIRFSILFFGGGVAVYDGQGQSNYPPYPLYWNVGQKLPIAVKFDGQDIVVSQYSYYDNEPPESTIQYASTEVPVVFVEQGSNKYFELEFKSDTAPELDFVGLANETEILTQSSIERSGYAMINIFRNGNLNQGVNILAAASPHNVPVSYFAAIRRAVFTIINIDSMKFDDEGRLIS